MRLATHLPPAFLRKFSSMATKGPLVAVIGTTGAGKSRVAIDIALACNGEIINADAMQIYRGLDVITNKVTEEEMRGVKHHLMGFKDPGEESFVTEWLNMAIKTVSHMAGQRPVHAVYSNTSQIESIHKSQKLPIVVGGTSYWLQNLLFANRIVTETTQGIVKPREEPDSSLKAALEDLEASELALYQNLPDRPPIATSQREETFRLWKLLDKLDPKMAARWHWKDSRKVLRNLEIMVEKGQKASEVIKKQDAEPLESRLALSSGFKLSI
jgi:tRNA dimethylallyltransferase